MDTVDQKLSHALNALREGNTSKAVEEISEARNILYTRDLSDITAPIPVREPENVVVA